MNVQKWKVKSILVSIILGTLLHFTYEWSGNNKIVGIFSAVNESTWEHLKLAFFPMLLMAIIGYFFVGKGTPNYIKGNVIGIIVAISFITAFFYTYTGIIGDNFFLIDIATFIIAVILGENCAYKIMQHDAQNQEAFYLGIISILLIFFVVFTYYPPHINLFKDPITGTYGIQ